MMTPSYNKIIALVIFFGLFIEYLGNEDVEKNIYIFLTRFDINDKVKHFNYILNI